MKTILGYTALLSGLAYGILELAPALLNYYYMVLSAVGIYRGVKTRSNAYYCLVAVCAIVYAIENNPDIWHEFAAHQLTLMYFIMSWVVYLLCRSDDDLMAAKYVTGVMALKWLVSLNYPGLIDSSYLYHTIINVLSIAQWTIIIVISARRSALNKGQVSGVKKPPMVLKVAESWMSITRSLMKG